MTNTRNDPVLQVLTSKTPEAAAQMLYDISVMQFAEFSDFSRTKTTDHRMDRINQDLVKYVNVTDNLSRIVLQHITEDNAQLDKTNQDTERAARITFWLDVFERSLAKNDLFTASILQVALSQAEGLIPDNLNARTKEIMTKFGVSANQAKDLMQQPNAADPEKPFIYLLGPENLLWIVNRSITDTAEDYIIHSDVLLLLPENDLARVNKLAKEFVAIQGETNTAKEERFFRIANEVEGILKRNNIDPPRRADQPLVVNYVRNNLLPFVRDGWVINNPDAQPDWGARKALADEKRMGATNLVKSLKDKPNKEDLLHQLATASKLDNEETARKSVADILESNGFSIRKMTGQIDTASLNRYINALKEVDTASKTPISQQLDKIAQDNKTLSDQLVTTITVNYDSKERIQEKKSSLQAAIKNEQEGNAKSVDRIVRAQQTFAGSVQEAKQRESAAMLIDLRKAPDAELKKAYTIMTTTLAKTAQKLSSTDQANIKERTETLNTKRKAYEKILQDFFHQHAALLGVNYQGKETLKSELVNKLKTLLLTDYKENDTDMTGISTDIKDLLTNAEQNLPRGLGATLLQTFSRNTPRDQFRDLSQAIQPLLAAREEYIKATGSLIRAYPVGMYEPATHNHSIYIPTPNTTSLVQQMMNSHKLEREVRLERSGISHAVERKEKLVLDANDTLDDVKKRVSSQPRSYLENISNDNSTNNKLLKLLVKEKTNWDKFKNHYENTQQHKTRDDYRYKVMSSVNNIIAILNDIQTKVPEKMRDQVKQAVLRKYDDFLHSTYDLTKGSSSLVFNRNETDIIRYLSRALELDSVRKAPRTELSAEAHGFVEQYVQQIAPTKTVDPYMITNADVAKHISLEKEKYLEQMKELEREKTQLEVQRKEMKERHAPANQMRDLDQKLLDNSAIRSQIQQNIRALEPRASGPIHQTEEKKEKERIYDSPRRSNR